MFFDAWNGLAIAWEEKNFRIDVIAAILVLIASRIFGLSAFEFIVVVAMIGLVMTAEVFNTALEELCDKFQPEHDPHIGKIKDLAAAAVFLSSVAAFVVGCVVFLPHILSLFA